MSEIKIEFAGDITHIERIANRAQMDALESEHIWTSPLIDMRFNYKPQNPLYLLLVRGSCVAECGDDSEYAGVCRVQKLGAVGRARSMWKNRRRCWMMWPIRVARKTF